MAKAFDELEALGLVGPDRPRMVCVQSAASTPIVRAFESHAPDIEPRPPGRTIATGLNVAQNIGHVNVLRIIRADRRLRAGGLRGRHRRRDPRRVARPPFRLVARRRRDRSPRCPSWPIAALIRAGDRVVLVNTASAEKYLPAIRELLDGGL